MNLVDTIIRTNVRLISVLLLLVTLTACSTTGTRSVSAEAVCATNQILYCESYASERRCRCGDARPLALSPASFGPIPW